MKFNIAKCKVRLIGTKHLEEEYKMADEKIDEITEEIDLGVIISRSLKTGKQCAKAACRVIRKSN
jgi:5-carboxymethyl-2-hydroxymuconate isomerase